MNPTRLNDVPNQTQQDVTLYESLSGSLPNFFLSELTQVAALINDKQHQLHILSAENLTPVQISDFLRHNLLLDNPDQMKLNTSEFLQKYQPIPADGTVFSLPGRNDKKHIIILFNKPYHDFALWRLLISTLQEKWHYAAYFHQMEQAYWKFRQKGCSAEKTDILMRTTYFNYEKVSKISFVYKNMQANIAATAAIFIKAMQNDNIDELSSLKHNLLTTSAQRSDALFNPANSISQLDFPICRTTLEQIINGGKTFYLHKSGLIDWEKLYNHTLTAVKNIGYTPHAILDADQKECQLLQMMKKQYPERKMLLNMLLWTNEYQGSKILQNFAQAQKFLLQNSL